MKHSPKRCGVRASARQCQEALGCESGYRRTSINMLERGRRNPSLRTILSIAAWW
jgi:DNA-binding XRE family transcriptional regulator